MNRNTYRPIASFGSNEYAPINNPLTYCMSNTVDSRFMHGGASDTMGQHSKPCQMYMSEYCASKWDDFCELASRNTNTDYPNNVQQCGSLGDTACVGLNAGEILIRNTAAQKYLVEMMNGKKKYEPFDPTVASSPMISYWVSNSCSSDDMVPVYSVNPSLIDQDPVMNKIINNPMIAFGILVNIYNTMKRKGTLKQLHGTKLGHLYNNLPYFKNKGGLS